MPIYPLPVFEADLEADRLDREAYAKLKAPTSIVIRFGSMRLVGEFPYSGDSKPGCGSKLVARTHRGTEIGEMLTSTCPNAGCSKSVTRQEMLQYIENSGGKDYPFFDQGRILRVATVDDLNEQRRIEALKPAMRKACQAKADAAGHAMKIVECEPILGGERLTIYFTSEERIDFRELVNDLAAEYACRIEMRQVGARDEARLIADYERCGQHCCCKQFLKVLKPISMKAAKTQKATLDPLKISGRCGRLMCCLRYEDQTYTELDKRLPRLKARVGTNEGPGTVVDRQILTQLVLVQLELEPKQIAVPLEELVPVEESIEIAAKRKAEAPPDPLRGMNADRAGRRAAGNDRGQSQQRQRDRAGQPPAPARPDRRPPRPETQPPEPAQAADTAADLAPADEAADAAAGPDAPARRRRRRRRSRSDGPVGHPPEGARGPETAPGSERAPHAPGEPRPPRRQPPPAAGEGSSTDAPSSPDDKRPRRRRRRRGGGGGGGGPRPDGSTGRNPPPPPTNQ